ncbi:acyltransferase [Microbacterium sp. HMWF026]|uniref:acyltransferase family protein n=1 Tax=Microbacterium sp. HMWF026 TaxID=2056861 RepID=UPI000D3CE47A|nr:acyltransferase [Microbacterium sp. HMWF026]PTT22361.1 acyltransferase [Microbacterium sp. HMWF026]
MSTHVSPAAGPDLSRRDPTLDLARVAAVFLVVVVHLLQVGVGRGPDGAIVTSRPAEAQSWFDAATWVGQIMPLFFVVGGFASAAGWASWTARGGDAAGFVRTRTLRLVQPALALFGVVAAVLLGGRAAGVDPSLIDAAVVGIGMPLWFLAAYLLCQLVVPVAVSAHDRAPRLSLGILLSATIAVDALRFSTGIELLGYLNMLFVWPLIQQLGFWYRDGWFDRRGTPALLAVAGAAYLLLGIIVAWGPYSSSMLANLNPPTLPLVLLGVAQACLLRVARPVLAGLMRTRAAQAVVFAMGSRLMTVYLWHLPVILVVSGLALLVPGAAPVPASGEWWATRPVLLVVVALVLGALSLPLARIEALGRLGAAPRPWLIGVAWLLAFLPPFAVTVEGMDAVLAVCGAAMYMAAVLILRTRSR